MAKPGALPEGWLQRQDKKGWHKYYARLRPDALALYSNQGDVTEKRALLIKGASATLSKEREEVIEWVTSHDHKHSFLFASPQEAKSWLDAMVKLISAHQNSAGAKLAAPPPPPPKDPALVQEHKPTSAWDKQRYAIVEELLRMEEAYHLALTQLKKHWHEPLRNAHPPLVDEKTVSDIFSTYERFLAVSGRMLRSLQNKVRNWKETTSIVDLLVDEVSLLHTYYRDYSANFEIALRTIDTLLKEKPVFRTYYKLCTQEAACALDLVGLLTLPLQKIRHLMLAIQALYQLSISSAATHAAGMPAGGNSFEALNLAPILAALHTVTSNADEGFSRGEELKLRRAQTVGKNNHPLLGSDNAERRVFYEGSLQKVCRNAATKSRYFILFSDCLVRLLSDVVAYDICNMYGKWDGTRLRVSHCVPITSLRVQDVPDHIFSFKFFSAEKSFEVSADCWLKWVAYAKTLAPGTEQVLEAPVYVVAVHQWLCDKWVPDSQAPKCQNCGDTFSLMVRRHHCRYCGRVVCAKCSTKRAQLGTLGHNVRICTLCDNFLAGNTWDAGIPLLKPEDRLVQSANTVTAKSRGVVDEHGEEGVPQNAKWDRPFYLLTAQLGAPILLPPAPSPIIVNRQALEFNAGSKRLYIRTPYKESLHIANNTDRAISVNITPLLTDGKEPPTDGFSLNVSTRVLKLAAGEGNLVVVDIEAWHAITVDTVLALHTEGVEATHQDTLIRVRASFEPASESMYRAMLPELQFENSLEQIQALTAWMIKEPEESANFQRRLHALLADPKRGGSASKLLSALPALPSLPSPSANSARKETVSALTPGRSAASLTEGTPPVKLLVSKYHLDFDQEGEFDTYKQLRDELTLENCGHEPVLELHFEFETPVSSKAHFVFTPNSGTLRSGQSIKIVVSLVAFEPHTVTRLIRLKVEGIESQLFACSLKAISWNTPECELEWEKVKDGTPIAKGAAGAVTKTTLNGQVVAVKRFNTSADEGEPAEIVADFYRETKILSRLKHPNIVKFMGACTKWPNLAIVMEFAPHGSLMGIIQNQQHALPWPLRLKFALDIAKGCHYLHCNKVYHRDLKSPNILIMSLDTAENVTSAVVTDFNTSKMTEKQKKSMLKRTMTMVKASQLGTLAWSAPEVLEEKFPDDKGDVYSFAVILWEIVARVMPYHEWKFDFQVAAHVVKGGRLPIPAVCPPKWAELIFHCWAQTPEERPPFSDILFDLEQLRLRKDKLEEEANAAAARKVPADVRAKQVLWVTSDRAAAESVIAPLTKDKPDVSYVIVQNVEELREWLKERELVLCSHGGDASMRVIYTPPPRPAQSGSRIGLEFGPGVFLQWLRTSSDSPFPRVHLLLSGNPAELPTLANFADHLTTVTCQPQVVRSFAAWEKIIA